ncbi:MAG: hypothetical protein F4Y02_17980 [Chloroflexi bacterium]|nr:hypothetical protein [Chloroflexota bacterium]
MSGPIERGMDAARAAVESPIDMWSDLALSAFTPALGSGRDDPEERAKALARRKKPQTARRRTDVQATRTERPSRQRRRWWERTFGTPYTGQLTDAEAEGRADG